MTRLDIDFVKVRPGSPWVRWVLFAIALVFCVDLGVSYFTLRQRIAENQQRLGEIQRSTDGAAKAAMAAKPPTPDELRVARETAQRLAMPWGTLFKALESSASDNVTLFAIDPQPKSGTVLISGEAVNYRAVLDYVALLGAAGTLERPHLLRHERKQDGPQDTVAFSILASWGKSK